jgi:hypothetical protein
MLTIMARLGLSLVTLGIIWVGWRHTRHRDQARGSVRELLRRCEVALGLYQVGIFVPSALYDKGLLQFPAKGGWLSKTFWVAALAALGFS